MDRNDLYIGASECFTYEGQSFRVTVEHDADHDAPWDNEDGHGPVSEWTTRDKAPGELVLCEDGRSKRYYDFAEACRIARRDGWGFMPHKLTIEADDKDRAPIPPAAAGQRLAPSVPMTPRTSTRRLPRSMRSTRRHSQAPDPMPPQPQWPTMTACGVGATTTGPIAGLSWKPWTKKASLQVNRKACGASRAMQRIISGKSQRN